ncbi:hypothetical protein BY458DRAFT_511406 [Sporodiniella umbellata]|nr:hypothetical protein BY458DRAFT_511406 [Sporodiniella umbellata]
MKETKQRNSPCEHCRKHRRRCISTEEKRCDRCQRAKIECVFKRSEKPVKNKGTVSVSQQNQLLTAVWALGRQEQALRVELSRLKSVLGCTECGESGCQVHRPWTLAVTKEGQQIQIETSIRSLSELERFLREGQRFFQLQESVPRPCSGTGGVRALSVTFPRMKVDAVFRTLFGAMARARPTRVVEDSPGFLKEWASFKLQMVESFFDCYALLVPILPIAIYRPRLVRAPEHLLTLVVSYLAGSGPCAHTDLSGYHYSRTALTLACRAAAREKLEECLFEEDATAETCSALLLMSLASIYAFRGGEARVYGSLCWNMIRRMAPGTDGVQEQVRARTFYLARYLEYVLVQSQDDDAGCYGHTVYHIDLVPKALACEGEHTLYHDSLQCFQFLNKLMTLSRSISPHEVTLFHLFSGRLGSIASSTVVQVEQALIDIWHSLAPHLRLGAGPFAYSHIDSSACAGFVLRVNAAYYVYWLSLQTKIMQSPQAPVMAYGARLGGDRALEMASMCADTATQIYARMARVAPCLFEIRWLATTLDILHLLVRSPDLTIQTKAKSNILVLSPILQDQLGIDHRTLSYPVPPEQHTPTTHITSIFTHMKSLLQDYLVHHHLFQPS